VLILLENARGNRVVFTTQLSLRAGKFSRMALRGLDGKSHSLLQYLSIKILLIGI